MSLTLDAYVPFATDVSKGTGLDFYTVLGWVNAEGGPEGNPINLVPGRNYGDEHGAANAVIGQLTSPRTMEPGIIASARASYPSEDAAIAAQAHAIAQSPWNDPNGKGSASRAQYEQNIKAGAVTAIYSGTKPGETFTPTDPKNPTRSGGSVVPPADPLTGIAAALDAIGRAFSWVTDPENWKRVGIFLLGATLAIGGLYIAVKG